MTDPIPSALQPKSSEERKALLAQTLAYHLGAGRMRVISQSDYQVVLASGGNVNHTLHLILTIVTCGLWGLVWLVIAVTQSEKRFILSVDEYGNVNLQGT